MGYDRERVGKRLRSGIVDMGLTVDEFAQMAGVSRFSLNEWMIGRSGMTLDSAVAVCDVLGWPLDRLVVREERN